MQLFIELLAVVTAAFVFLTLCALATYVFESVFHSRDDGDWEEDECIADETISYPLQHPSNFTDHR